MRQGALESSQDRLQRSLLANTAARQREREFNASNALANRELDLRQNMGQQELELRRSLGERSLDLQSKSLDLQDKSREAQYRYLAQAMALQGNIEGSKLVLARAQLEQQEDQFNRQYGEMTKSQQAQFDLAKQQLDVQIKSAVAGMASNPQIQLSMMDLNTKRFQDVAQAANLDLDNLYRTKHGFFGRVWNAVPFGENYRDSLAKDVATKYGDAVTYDLSQHAFVPNSSRIATLSNSADNMESILSSLGIGKGKPSNPNPNNLNTDTSQSPSGKFVQPQPTGTPKFTWDYTSGSLVPAFAGATNQLAPLTPPPAAASSPSENQFDTEGEE